MCVCVCVDIYIYIYIYIYHCCTGSPSQSNQAKKLNKRFKIGKGKVKMSLFAGDMILYIQNPKDSTKKTVRSNQ